MGDRDLSTPPTNAEILKILNESGFPLQLALQRIADDDEGWQTDITEHAWRDPNDGKEKFVDLVVSQVGNLPIRLVVEAKRALLTDWLFLCERSLDDQSVLVTRAVGESVNRNGYMRVQCAPQSPLALFCVIGKRNPDGFSDSKDLIERDASALVRATDAVAAHEAMISDKARLRQVPIIMSVKPVRVYIPVIVTTANLYCAFGDYSTVDLLRGELPNISAQQVPWVRFSKSLIVPEPDAVNPNFVKALSGMSHLAERTVMVVEAQHFADFLRELKLDLMVNEPWLTEKRS